MKLFVEINVHTPTWFVQSIILQLYERKLMAIVLAFKKLIPHLLSQHSKVRRNQRSLKSLLERRIGRIGNQKQAQTCQHMVSAYYTRLGGRTWRQMFYLEYHHKLICGSLKIIADVNWQVDKMRRPLIKSQGSLLTSQKEQIHGETAHFPTVTI